MLGSGDNITMTTIDRRMENLVNVISSGPRDDRLQTETKLPCAVTALAWAPRDCAKLRPKRLCCVSERLVPESYRYRSITMDTDGGLQNTDSARPWLSSLVAYHRTPPPLDRRPCPCISSISHRSACFIASRRPKVIVAVRSEPGETRSPSPSPYG
jgi:hypothetical protein